MSAGELSNRSFHMEPCKVFFVSVLYLSFFLGPFPYLFPAFLSLFFSFFLSFVFLFFFFPSMHCEWVINRPKAGCKFSTIRFVLLLHCCLLIVCVLVTFIPNSLFFSLSLSSFPAVYPSNIFYKKDQILQLFFSFFCVRVCVTGPLIMKTTIEEVKWIRCKWGPRFDGCHNSNGPFFIYCYLFILIFIFYKMFVCVGGWRRSRNWNETRTYEDVRCRDPATSGGI